jgi:hypothetical protein
VRFAERCLLPRARRLGALALAVTSSCSLGAMVDRFADVMTTEELLSLSLAGPER